MSNSLPLLARAEAAFRAGRLEEADRDLTQVIATQGKQPAACHLLALVARRRGDAARADALFRRALADAPHDAQLHNNYANLLLDSGALDRALEHYEAAAQFGGEAFIEARYHRAVVLHRLGRDAEALTALDDVLRTTPDQAATHSQRAIVLRALGRLDDAAAAFDRALALQPTRAVSLYGRARVALERGEADAASLFQRCIAAGAGDRDVLLGLANALEAEGDPKGAALLANAVAQFPDWIEAQEELARMRAEAGEGAMLTAGYRAALSQRPRDLALHLSHWRTLARAERHTEALAAIAAARPDLPDLAETWLAEATIAVEARDGERADAALARVTGHPDAAVPAARRALAAGDPVRAAALLDERLTNAPDDIAAWAYCDLAWRLTNDPRHEWLSRQPGLIEAVELGLTDAMLDELAALLRSLHRARAHPIGQSLRTGTQTRGRLLERTEPALRALRARLQEAIAIHLAALPPHDEAHPLLRHRDATPKLAGSWSVRLTDAGFHVSHIHTAGVLSSAMYVALPDGLDGATREGWLELGRPPAALGLALEPLMTIKPRPGRLALFPSYIFHGTRPFARGERLSVAFDVIF
jgi:Tfp pilus assembly protein PilF